MNVPFLYVAKQLESRKDTQPSDTEAALDSALRASLPPLCPLVIMNNNRNIKETLHTSIPF